MQNSQDSTERRNERVVLPPPPQQLRSELLSKLFSSDAPVSKRAVSRIREMEAICPEEPPVDIMHQHMTRRFITKVTKIIEDLNPDESSFYDEEMEDALGIRKTVSDLDEDLHIKVFGMSEDEEERPSNMFIDDDCDDAYFEIEKESIFQRATRYLFSSFEARRNVPKAILSREDYMASSGIMTQ